MTVNDANDSLIDDIPIFDRKPELHFDWILKVENIAVVTKCNPTELDLGKAQGMVIKIPQTVTRRCKLEQY